MTLKESIHFYRGIPGFKGGYHVDLPNGQITIMESPDGACAELIKSPDFETGLYSIGTKVDNLDEEISDFKVHGYSTTGPVIRTTVGKQTFVLDPNGVRICLIEHFQAYRDQYLQR